MIFSILLGYILVHRKLFLSMLVKWLVKLIICKSQMPIHAIVACSVLCTSVDTYITAAEKVVYKLQAPAARDT